jgi:hypothetical protein
MADPKDQNRPDGAGKRPMATIEGTAIEVPVEPSEAARPAEDASADDGEGSQPALTASSGQTEAPDETTKPEEIVGQAMPPSRPPATMPELKGFATHLAAGLLGGLVGVVAFALLWQRPPASQEAGPSPDIAKIEERLAKLEAAPAPSDDDAALGELKTRIDALENRKPETPPELSQLTDRVAQLEATLKSMADAAREGGSPADSAVIVQQIGEAEQRLQAKIDKTLADEKEANAAKFEAMQSAVAELKAKFAALAEAELGISDGGDVQPELQAFGERLAKLEARFPKLAEAVAQGNAETRSATVAIAFANLQAAVDDGRPFAAELDTISTISSEVGDFGALPAYAEKGIPTFTQLTQSFATTKDAALAISAPAAQGSIIDSLMASAESLVKIRRVDEAAAGDSPSAVLARAEAKLRAGNLAETVREVETLKDTPRTAFSGWVEQARARLGAADTLRRLEGILLVSVGGAATAPAEQPEQD